jgi:hypothetical protein
MRAGVGETVTRDGDSAASILARYEALIRVSEALRPITIVTRCFAVSRVSCVLWSNSASSDSASTTKRRTP